MSKTTYERMAEELDQKNSVRRLRAYNPDAAVEMVAAQAALAVAEIKERLGALRSFMTDDQACELIRTVHPGYLQQVYHDGYAAGAGSAKPALRPRQEPVTATQTSQPLFPYASSAIMNRVQSLVKDVEFIRSRVLDENGQFFSTEEGQPTASVRDLSSFVGAVNSLYTTVGNLESLDKMRQDMNKVTHAISEAALTLPAEHRTSFLDAFRDVISRK